jgi:hypothetical protein
MGSSSQTVAHLKEAAKQIPLRRILLNNETDIRSFLGSIISADAFPNISRWNLRLDANLSVLPGSSTKNLANFIMMRFTHKRATDGSAWHIELLSPDGSGSIKYIGGLFTAVCFFELGFSQIFRSTSGEFNNLLLDALTPIKRVLQNQNDSTTFKHFPIEFVEEHLVMRPLCRMAEVLHEPATETIRDQSTLSAALAKAAAFNEDALHREGSFKLLTSSLGKTLRAPTSGGGKPQQNPKGPKLPRTDPTRPPGGSPPYNSAHIAAKGPHSTATQGTPQWPKPCISHIQYLLGKSSTTNNTFKECKNQNCNFDHGPIPNPFDSPEHKAFYIGVTAHIKDNKFRDWVRGELLTIPPSYGSIDLRSCHSQY